LKDHDDTSEEAAAGESTDVEGIVSMITGGEQDPEESVAIDTSDAQAVKEMTDEEIEQAAAEAERLARSQVANLEKNISTLVTKGDAIIKDFHNLLEAFNAQEINDLTVTVTGYKYNTPKVVSGAFIRAAIKTAGPVCAIGFMLCMVLIIISRKREEKRAAKE
jgi:short subunit fatty acids transporter